MELYQIVKRAVGASSRCNACHGARLRPAAAAARCAERSWLRQARSGIEHARAARRT